MASIADNLQTLRGARTQLYEYAFSMGARPSNRGIATIANTLVSEPVPPLLLDLNMDEETYQLVINTATPSAYNLSNLHLPPVGQIFRVVLNGVVATWPSRYTQMMAIWEINDFRGTEDTVESLIAFCEKLAADTTWEGFHGFTSRANPTLATGIMEHLSPQAQERFTLETDQQTGNKALTINGQH